MSPEQLPQQKTVQANNSIAICESSILAAFPPGTFLENIAVDDNGIIFITSVEDGVVYEITPAGKIKEFGKTTGKLAGILLVNNAFFLNGWNETGVATIYSMDRSGDIIPLHQPENAVFLNGMASLTETEVLVCDAYKGCILLYNTATNRSAVWLAHPLLSKIDMQQQFMPSANGIKIHDRIVYVSNTERKLLLKIPLIDQQPGEPEIFLDQLNLDDFAIDQEGTIYATTHIYNSVVKITQDKTVTTIAEEAQGLAGSTAVAFGRTSQDSDCIYVTTNGGISLPYEGRIQNGRVVKIKIR